MTPVGHSLVGLSIAALAIPATESTQRKVVGAAGFVLLASVPDWPLPGWGHDRYDISHSAVVTVGLIVVISLAIARSTRLPGRYVAFGGVAWLSHLLLDSFYQHDLGVNVGWPIGDYNLNFAIPWFDTLDLSYAPWHRRNLSVFAIEAAAYLPVLLLAVASHHSTKPDLATSAG